jgi:NitT/TauT family transport system substrate-binding protein
MTRLSRRDFIGAAAGLAIASACGPAGTAGASPASSAAGSAARTASPSPKPIAVKGAWVAVTSNQMVWPVAKEAGYFTKYGVDFDLSFINSSNNAIAAMLSGEVGLITSAGAALVSSVAGGADIVMLAGFVNKMIFRIIGAPGITSIDQVKGKTIAVTRIGTADYFAWQAIVAHQGWKMSDLNFIAAQDAPGQVAVLKSGNAAAIAVSPPNNILALQAGGKEILDTASYNEPEQNVGIVATRKWLTENRPAAVAVMKASIEAIARWKKDPAFVKSVIKTYLKNDDQLFLDVGYSAYVDIFQQAPYPSEEGMAKVIEEVSAQTPNAKTLKAAQLIDRSIVQELETSGFIKQIYG